MLHFLRKLPTFAVFGPSRIFQRAVLVRWLFFWFITSITVTKYQWLLVPYWNCRQTLLFQNSSVWPGLQLY